MAFRRKSERILFPKNEPFDIRYNSESPLTAEKILNTFSAEEIEKILKEFGEEKFAKRIAEEIIKTRKINLCKLLSN